MPDAPEDTAPRRAFPASLDRFVIAADTRRRPHRVSCPQTRVHQETTAARPVTSGAFAAYVEHEPAPAPPPDRVAGGRSDRLVDRSGCARGSFGDVTDDRLGR